MTALPLAANNAEALKRRVKALTENRPGVYRMLNSVGRVIYVGQSKTVRNRLLSYFRTGATGAKATRIIEATHDIDWRYTPSEFSSRVVELELIKKYRPRYNVRMNRARNVAFVKIAGSPAPKIYVGKSLAKSDTKIFGPLRSPARVADAVRVLNDLLGLRDCALDMPTVYAEQTDMFAPAQRAACIRYELRTCSGPCAGFVSEADYTKSLSEATAFLDARTVEPINRVIDRMDRFSRAKDYEGAARWRDKFEALEWLFAEINKARSTMESLTFVYVDPGTYGDDRAYVIRRAEILGTAPAPRTPIEREAFKAKLDELVSGTAPNSLLDPDKIDQNLLVLSWFKRHPSALRRTYPYSHWLEA